MKAVNFALVALAGLGLVTSQVAFADTLPGSALPTVSHAHPAKMVRLTEKHDGVAAASESQIAGGFPLLGLLFAAAAAGLITYSIIKVSKSSSGT